MMGRDHFGAIKYFLVVFSLPLIFGCSNEFKDPEIVVRSFRDAISQKDLNKGYKYISSESQKNASLNEFQSYYNESKPSKILQLNVLPEDKEKSSYRRVKVVDEAVDDKGKSYKSIIYYTLINEDGKWKILWLENIKKTAEEQNSKGFYEEAIKLYEKVLSLDPYNGATYGHIGWCRQRMGKGEEAVTYFKKAVMLEPDNPSHYNSFASYYLERHLHSLAIENIEKAISMGYGSDYQKASFYVNLSVALRGQGDYKKAMVVVDKAIELIPLYAFAYMQKGDTLVGRREYEEASKQYLKALDLNEKNEDKLEQSFLFSIYYRLSGSEYNLADYVNAKTHIMKALEITPENKDAQELYSLIKAKVK